MGAGLEGTTPQLEGERQLISLPYFHGPSHVFQFSYCKVKGSTGMVLLGGLSKTERKRQGDWLYGLEGWLGVSMQQKQKTKKGNSPPKIYLLSKTKGSANTNM